MKVQIEKFNENDIQNLIKWIDSPEAPLMWASRTYPYPLSKEIALKHFEKTKKSPSDLMIFKATLGTSIIGHIELEQIDFQSRSARISRLFIDKGFRKIGVAQELINFVLQIGFNDLDLNRISIFVIEGNDSALRLYKKIGFIQEGFLRENMILKDKKLGSYVLSLLKTEFNLILNKCSSTSLGE